MVVTTIVAAFMAASWQPDSTWCPWLTWKPLVFFPIVYGILAVAVMLDRGLSLTARSTRILWAKWCGTMTN